MDTRVLRYFLAVAKEKNITKAADVLHTSQSNLSKQLSELESEIGKTLFTRGSRKITLTEEGLFLYKRAQEIVELLERTEMDLQTYNEEISGTVHIGAIESFVMRWFGDAIGSLRQKYPDIKYDFFSGSITEITEQLDKGLLDFAVLVAPVDMQKYDYVKIPVSDSFGILMNKNCPLAELPYITPNDIRDYPVWVAQQQLQSNVLSGWLGRDVNSLNILATFNLITNPAIMIEQGLGMAFTFDHLVNTAGNRNLTFRPLMPKVEAELYLVWKKNSMFTKASDVFLKHLQQVLLTEA